MKAGIYCRVNSIEQGGVKVAEKKTSMIDSVVQQIR